MEALEREKDYIILRSIARFGYAAMPQDYAFLCRYSMKVLYFELLSRVTAGGDTKHLEADVKSLATSSLIGDCHFPAFQEYINQYGNRGVKTLLGNNQIYWKTFLTLKKKIKYEFNTTDKKDIGIA